MDHCSEPVFQWVDNSEVLAIDSSTELDHSVLLQRHTLELMPTAVL